MKDNEIVQIIEKTLKKKINENNKFIRYSFYELKVVENLTDEEMDRFLELIKIKLEKDGYTVLFTGTKFVYESSNRTVQSNELIIAIKDYERML